MFKFLVASDWLEDVGLTVDESVCFQYLYVLTCLGLECKCTAFHETFSALLECF